MILSTYLPTTLAAYDALPGEAPKLAAEADAETRTPARRFTSFVVGVCLRCGGRILDAPFLPVGATASYTMGIQQPGYCCRGCRDGVVKAKEVPAPTMRVSRPRKHASTADKQRAYRDRNAA